MTRRAFILGDGQIGRAVAANFIANGWSVVTGCRTRSATASKDVHLLDRDTPGALAAAIGDGFDAVLDTVAFDASHAAQWRGLVEGIGTLVIVSSMSVYVDDVGRTLDEARETGFPRFPVPIPEDCPRVAPGPTTYSTRKVALEDAVMALDLPTVILRPCAVYGTGSRAPREWWFIQRALAGHETIPVAWDAASRFHPAATRNIAELARVAVEAGGSHVLNATDADCPTVAELGTAILSAMESQALIVPFKGPPRDMVGRTPWSIPHSMIGDMRAAAALGYRPVTTYFEEMPAVCAALVEAARVQGWQSAFPGLAAYPPGFFDVPERGDR